MVRGKQITAREYLISKNFVRSDGNGAPITEQLLEEFASIREKEAFEAGRKYGREEGLFDHSILERHECFAPDFKDWRNTK